MPRTTCGIIVRREIIFDERVYAFTIRVIKEREILTARAVGTTDRAHNRVFEMRVTIAIEF